MFANLKRVTIVALLTFFGVCPSAAFAESAIKLQGEGAIDISTPGVHSFVLSGTASHLGRYTCHGEITLQRGAAGSLDGEGVAVFEAANGDLLVGVVSYHTGADGTGTMRFSWRDFVQFSDGAIVSNTGRFVTSRPPGAFVPIQTQLLVVIAIIAILIG